MQTDNYWEALELYSGNSHCRGYVNYDKGTIMSKKSIKAACGEQWQQMWGLTEFLVMHPDDEMRFFDDAF